jgi:predicted  nucleic acid-binding Zn-ribbon protein
MIERLVRLFELQNIDRAILERERLIQEIPQRMARLEEELAGRKEELEEVQQRITEDHNRELAVDKMLQETKMRITRHKKQLMLVKTNKEYAALLKEISTEEASIERLEEEMLEILDEKEGIEKEQQEVQNEFKKMQDRFERDKKALEEKEQLFNREIEERKQERTRVEAEVDGQLLKRYEKIRSARDGIAVVQIQGENCGGCFAAIPPQKINEAKKGDKILTCESCGRILFYNGKGGGGGEG